MSTIQQTVDKAAYDLGMIEYGANLDATDGADAMNVLNEMMHQWEQQDANFNWFTQDDLTDTLPIPDWAEGGVISNLAVRLATRFNIQPSQQLFIQAANDLNMIVSRCINENLTNTNMNHLPLGSGRHTRYDIDTDNF